MSVDMVLFAKFCFNFFIVNESNTLEDSIMILSSVNTIKFVLFLFIDAKQIT